MNRALAVLVIASALSSACGKREEEARSKAAAPSGLLARPLALRGVSLAGAEFGVDTFGRGAIPGALGVNYHYPDPSLSKGYTSADYFRAKGMNTFRIPFRWERLQPVRRQPFTTSELGHLETTVDHLTAKGAYVVLDVHNYARFKTGVLGKEVSSADFADLWSRLATVFKSNPKVVFALMNEPHDMPTEAWVDAANAAITAIRAAGAPNLILVEGNGYSGAHSWKASTYGTPNAEAMLKIVDPKGYLAFEVHQHLDDDSSGTSAECSGPRVGATRLEPFTAWLRAHHKKGFLGEFGAGTSTVCIEAIRTLLRHLEDNKDVYVGWTYWAAGPAWGDYFASIEPRGGDRPQMIELRAHLTW